MSMSPVSRAAARSSVGVAAYILRRPLTDERTGERHRPEKSMGLLAEGHAGWRGAPETLWSTAELAERRGDARVARELIISLPVELDLDSASRLLRGYSAWLHDEYGIGVTWALHAPHWRDKALGQAMWENRQTQEGAAALQSAIRDPSITNMNLHAHVLMTTRTVEPAGAGRAAPDPGSAPQVASPAADADPTIPEGPTLAGAGQGRRKRRDALATDAAPDEGDMLAPRPPTLGPKVRILDDLKTGPAEVERLRQEWQRRANRLLEQAGVEARIDMRSYERQAAAGDAPEGLVPQEHLGARATQDSRMRVWAYGVDDSRAGRRRQKTIEANDALWDPWLAIRALRRQQAREDGTSARIAAAREAARRGAVTEAQDGAADSQPPSTPRPMDQAGSSKARIPPEPTAPLECAPGTGQSEAVAIDRGRAF